MRCIGGKKRKREQDWKSESCTFLCVILQHLVKISKKPCASTSQGDEKKHEVSLREVKENKEG